MSQNYDIYLSYNEAMVNQGFNIRVFPHRTKSMHKIIIVLLSEIDTHFTDALRQNIEKTFNHPVEVRNKINSLEYAYDPIRDQYKSPFLLSRLKRVKRSPGDKIMGVADVDLYSPGYDFVYGEADVNAGVATLSINRLITGEQDIPSNLNLYIDRIIREATHEIGHLYGLVHCSDQKCVMRTCTCVPEVDAAGGGLCNTCMENLNNNL